jgi:hypothetical protein
MEYVNNFFCWAKPIFNEMWPIFLATFFGALSAFQLQKNWERTKQKEKDFNSGKRAQFALVTQYTVLFNLNKQYLEEKRNDHNRFLTLLPLTVLPNFQKIDVDSLLFILDDGDDANLLVEIVVAEQKFITAMGVLEQRNKCHSDFQKRAAKSSKKEALDDATVIALKGMAEDLYGTFDDAFSSNKDVFKKLGSYLKKKYPKKTRLEMKPL